MRPVRALDGGFNVMGTRVPRVVGLLVGLTLFASIMGAVGARNGVRVILQQGVLAPDLVWSGQLWRLVTWPFFELDGLSLIFGCLALFWFGRDLAHAWGPGRFLGLYLGFAAASGTATCLIGRLLWPELLSAAFLGPWAMVDALIIAWAILYPHRDVLVYFVLPLRGPNLIYATIGGTLLFALLNGIGNFVPHFMAEALMLAYMREGSLSRLWLRLRMGALQAKAGRRPAHLRPVEKDDWGKPPRWLH